MSTAERVAAVVIAVGLLIVPLGLARGEDSAAGEGPQAAARILREADCRGGLVVHVGCGDGQLTAALRPSETSLVQGLTRDPAQVAKAREHIRSLGSYGPVSIDRWQSAGLPFVDNLVNLLVVAESAGVSEAEMLRVLRPEGVAMIEDGGSWKQLVKPRPQAIDEWTHYLYDASGNAVGQDEVVGPPRHFQWQGSPRWSRHHDRRASVSAMVSAGGRVFYILDEGSTASIMLPARPALVARDAFNGTILWKRPIDRWFTHLWPFKSGPTQLQRRLVAVGDRVYATLGLDAPLVALDAATGQTLKTYGDSAATEEVLADDGVLFLLVNPSPQVYDTFRPEEVNIGVERDRVMKDFAWNEQPRQVMAVKADTGEILWQSAQRVVPLTLAADARRVYLHDGECLIALDRKNGEQVWRSPPVDRIRPVPSNITPTLVVYQDVVLFYGATRQLTGVSAESGKILWTGPHPRSGHYCPEDVLVAGGLVWGGEIAGGNDSGEFLGRDPQTGEVKSRFLPDIDIYFMHQRCYRSKATERWLIPGWTGTEFVDFRNEHWITNHWVRSGCIYGVMPCNGLVYTTPHDCACYMQAKLYGFCALAPESPGRPIPGEVPAAGRLERGPAYAAASGPADAAPAAGDWPTYRHDALRSGYTPTPVPPQIRRRWEVQLAAPLSAPVAAGGRIFLAEIDRHNVHALDADSGKSLWSFAAGGRVDSPPTIFEGRVLFGSADGYVYCLQAADGQLAWRFRAAPLDRRMVAFEQLESVWPVSGSVLVQDGIATCVAGRSMFVDGGLRFLRLDARTGELLSERILDERDPSSGENLQAHVEVRNMPVGLPDVLSSDGQRIYMRSQVMDLEGNRTPASLAQRPGSDADRAAVQQGEETHLFSPTGFLDDSWWHRSYWVYGRSFAEGAGGWPQAGKVAPAGRILAFNEATVYGFGRQPVYFQWRTPLEYHLFATSRQPEIVSEPSTVPAKRTAAEAPSAAAVKPATKPAAEPAAKLAKKAKAKAQPGPARVQHPQYSWSQPLPILVRALVLADETLFVAGPPDVLDEEDAFRRVAATDVQEKLAEQESSMRGQRGARLVAVSAADGSKLAEVPLETMPVFDGLIASRGRLYLATADGRLTCYSGE